jgi:hypothetical protein
MRNGRYGPGYGHYASTKQSFVDSPPAAAKNKKKFVGIRSCIPQMRGPHTPAKGYALCTPEQSSGFFLRPHFGNGV